MATKYLQKYATTAEFLANAPDRDKFQGLAVVGDLVYQNINDAAVAMVDVSTAQTLTNKTLTTPVLSGAVAVQTPVTAYAADGAIAITPGAVALTKAGVGAYTLAAPTAPQDGTILFIFSTTANAHVITATNLINDGVAPLLDTITFDNVAGAHIVLIAYNLTWYVLSQNATTATAGS